MSFLNYAITWSSKEMSEKMQMYTDALINRQYKISLSDTRNKLINTFKNNLSPYLKQRGSKTEEETFFKFLNDIQKDIISKSAENMAKQIQMGGSFQEVTQVADSKNMNTFARRLQQTIDTLSSVLDGFIDEEAIVSSLQLDNIISNINNNGYGIAVSQAKETSRDFFLGSNYSFKVNKTFKDSLSKQSKNIKSVRANLEVLKQLCKEAQASNGAALVPKDVSDFTRNFLISTFTYLGKIVGIFSEDFLKADIEKYVQEKILKNMQNKNGATKVNVAASGSQRGTVFNTKTTDVQISLDVQKMLNGKKGTVTLNLPGITLKRTRTSAGSNSKISLKTGASFQNFVTHMRIPQKHQKLQVFYNAFVNYRRSVDGHFIYSNKNQMEKMYAFYKVAMFPLAIAGSLNKDDFAYFMVVNDQTYNIIDIMEKTGSGVGLAQQTDVNFQDHQSQIKNLYMKSNATSREERDKMIIAAINQMHINYKIQRTLI